MANSPPWGFGRLLGVSVNPFFVAAHAINYFDFGAAPAPPTMVGGALILAGGLLVTFWH